MLPRFRHFEMSSLVLSTELALVVLPGFLQRSEKFSDGGVITDGVEHAVASHHDVIREAGIHGDLEPMEGPGSIAQPRADLGDGIRKVMERQAPWGVLCFDLQCGNLG